MRSWLVAFGFWPSASCSLLRPADRRGASENGMDAGGSAGAGRLEAPLVDGAGNIISLLAVRSLLYCFALLLRFLLRIDVPTSMNRVRLRGHGQGASILCSSNVCRLVDGNDQALLPSPTTALRARGTADRFIRCTVTARGVHVRKSTLSRDGKRFQVLVAEASRFRFPRPRQTSTTRLIPVRAHERNTTRTARFRCSPRTSG